MHRLALLSLPLLASFAFADTVTLTNGNELEGRVRYENGKVIVEQANGIIILDKSKVASVEVKKTALHEFDERLAALRGNQGAKAEDYAALAQYASDNSMKIKAGEMYKRAIQLDPNHEVARKALGYVLHDGAWKTPDEAAQARGLVKHDGKWVTPEAKDDIDRLKAAAEAERARAEAERLKLERLQRELDLVEAERERARARFEEEQYWDRYFDGAVIVGHSHRDRKPSPPPPTGAPIPPAPAYVPNITTSAVSTLPRFQGIGAAPVGTTPAPAAK